MLSIGPGRYKASKATKSSKLLMITSFKALVIPCESNWNILDVKPKFNISKVFLSLKEIFLISNEES